MSNYINFNQLSIKYTGKVGDLAAFASAIILGIIGLVILYEAIERLIIPARIEYLKAIPVGCIGLSVNIGSGIILLGICDKKKQSQEEIDMAHGHTHGHQVQHFDYDELDGMSLFRKSLLCAYVLIPIM